MAKSSVETGSAKKNTFSPGELLKGRAEVEGEWSVKLLFAGVVVTLVAGQAARTTEVVTTDPEIHS
jgi:hypothetical protein